MKLIVVGSSGFVGKELIRQALTNPAVTSVVGLARRETPVPESLKGSSDAAKLTSVVVDDFLNYSDNVRQHLANADACIWLMAVTPGKSVSMSWDEVRKVCLDYTLHGLGELSRAPRNDPSKPLSFVYVSGASAERDPTKKPWVLGNYSIMRGEVEARILDFTKDANNGVEACIVKPGVIRDAENGGFLLNTALSVASGVGVPVVSLHDVAATLLAQATEGIEKETLECADIARIGGSKKQTPTK
ncbi:NAD(P)-binding protein [Trichoderma novae-zelandiae]